MSEQKRLLAFVLALSVFLLTATPLIADQYIPPNSDYLSNLKELKIRTDMPAKAVKQEDGIIGGQAIVSSEPEPIEDEGSQEEVVKAPESEDATPSEEPATVAGTEQSTDLADAAQPEETETIAVTEQPAPVETAEASEQAQIVDSDTQVEEQPVADSTQPEETATVASMERPATVETTEVNEEETQIADSDEQSTQSTEEVDTSQAEEVEIAAEPDSETVEQSAVAETETAASKSETTIAETTTTAPDGKEIILGIQTALLGWASAWSDQDVEKYMSYYSDAFVPDNKNLSRKGWEYQRPKRLTKPAFIEVTLADIEIKLHIEEELYKAMFKQHYKSNTYEDRVIKEIQFVKEQNEWKILTEKSLKNL